MIEVILKSFKDLFNKKILFTSLIPIIIAAIFWGVIFFVFHTNISQFVSYLVSHIPFIGDKSWVHSLVETVGGILIYYELLITTSIMIVGVIADKIVDEINSKYYNLEKRGFGTVTESIFISLKQNILFFILFIIFIPAMFVPILNIFVHLFHFSFFVSYSYCWYICLYTATFDVYSFQFKKVAKLKMNIHYILEQFFNWISSYPSNMVLTILILIILIASILESLPIIGMMFPSESLTIFFGILAFKGIVDIRVLIITAYIGILMGDIIGYYLGKKVGGDFLKKHAKRLKIGSKKYDQIKDGINVNLIKVLFVGRSNGFTRWIAPFLAGANGISLKKFILANMLTAAFWAPAFLLGGYYLGDAFESYGKYFGMGIIIATILSIIIYKTYKHFENDELLQRDDFRLFIINIFGLYMFSKMAEDVLDLELVTKLDMWISSNISQFYTPILTKTMTLITSVDGI